MGPRVLVTGGSGFLGNAVLERLLADGMLEVRAALRRPLDLPGKIECRLVGDLGPDTDWQGALAGVDMVVHTAARVHVMRENAADPLAEFRQVNVLGTLNLARQAARAGARRFVFVSSIKVNGESTQPDRPFTAQDRPAPADPYGISKLEAEAGLRQLATDSGMDLTIIRPPLIYGPGVKANFLSMMRWLHSGVPLPLGAIHNRRSLVALENLVDLIACCLDHPAAANQTFLVSDGDDLSTTELLQRMAESLGKRARLLPVPAAVLSNAGTLLGKRAVVQRLCGSLQVDISSTRSRLGWTPPVAVDEALRRAARWFLESRTR